MRVDGAARLFQLLSRQESRRVRRRRRDRHERSGPGREDSPAALMGRGDALRAQVPRLQLSDGRRSGRGPRRQAEASRGVDRRAAKPGSRVSRDGCPEPRPSRRRNGLRRVTCTTSTSCACPTATHGGRRWPKPASRLAFTTRFPSTSSRHMRDLGYSRGDFPVAERAAAEVLSLPMFPELTDEQIETIAASSARGVLTGVRQ